MANYPDICELKGAAFPPDYHSGSHKYDKVH